MKTGKIVEQCHCINITGNRWRNAVVNFCTGLGSCPILTFVHRICNYEYMQNIYIVLHW